jgi:hypothetical protein
MEYHVCVELSSENVQIIVSHFVTNVVFDCLHACVFTAVTFFATNVTNLYTCEERAEITIALFSNSSAALNAPKDLGSFGAVTVATFSVIPALYVYTAQLNEPSMS